MKDTVSQCPIEQTMQLLSGRWPTLLVYYLSGGTKRFSELQRDNPTISHKMLTLELRKLESAGVISRTVHATVPPRVEYTLTEHGRKLVPLIDALGDWWEELDPRYRSAVGGAEPPVRQSKTSQASIT